MTVPGASSSWRSGASGLGSDSKRPWRGRRTHGSRGAMARPAPVGAPGRAARPDPEPSVPVGRQPLTRRRRVGLADPVAAGQRAGADPLARGRAPRTPWPWLAALVAVLAWA